MAVRSFCLDTLQFQRTLHKSMFDIRSIDFAPKGKYLGIGTDNPEIIMIDLKKQEDPETRLSGHSHPVTCIKFNPVVPLFLSSDTSGCIKLWEKGVKWSCVTTIDDLMHAADDEVLEWFDLCWNSIGTHFAVAGLHGDVRIYSKKSLRFKLSHFEDIAKVLFSPNGIYLLCIGFKKTVCVWRLENSRERPISNITHTERITDACWSPCGNEVCLADETGSIIFWKPFINEAQHPHPVTGTPSSLSLDNDCKEGLFGPEDEDEFDNLDENVDFEKLNELADSGLLLGGDSKKEAKNKLNTLVEVEAKEDNRDEVEEDYDDYEDMKDFVVDDDGAGYLEDMRKPEEVAKYHKRAQQNVIDQIERKHRERGKFQDHRIQNRIFPEFEIQASFQPGSTPAVGNRRYLAFNMIGTICSIDNSTHFTIDVNFHDSAHRPFHFTDHQQYILGCLGAHGAAFASEVTSTLPSVIHYRPIDGWASKNEWTMELPSGENAKGTNFS